MIEIFHDGVRDNYALRSAYEDIYSSRGIAQRDSFYLWLLAQLDRVKPLGNSKLLDVACGSGALVNFASKLGAEAVGVDLSLTALKGVKIHKAVANGEHLPFPSNSFDLVTSIGSLEHYCNPKLGASELARVLKDDGWACVLLPNAFSLIGNIKHVMLRGDVFDDGQPIQRYGTLVSWRRLLREGGLIPSKVIKYEIFPPMTLNDLLWYLRRPSKMLHLMVASVIPLNLACCFVFMCQKEQACNH